MAEKKVFKMAYPTARRLAVEAVQNAPEGYCVTVAAPTRSLDQNAALWPLLQAFADQLQWPVNGQMVWMSPDDWKAVLSAAFKRESIAVAMGMDGGMVMLGSRTSKFSVREMSEFLEFIHATAAAREVDFTYREPRA